jgi:hypothetical protein
MTDATSCPLFFLWFSFCLCSVVSLPVFARSPYVFLLGSVTVSGAVAAEDGALELLLKTKSRACCRITTVSPFVSLFCSFVPLFFSVRVLWFPPPWVLWGFVYSFLPRSLWPFSGFYKARECHAVASR